MKFQFHKGAIKTPKAASESKPKPGFNSIKVRLKRLLAGKGVLNGKFQFHKGAIKTLRNRLRIKSFSVSIP